MIVTVNETATIAAPNVFGLMSCGRSLQTLHAWINENAPAKFQMPTLAGGLHLPTPISRDRAGRAA